MIAPLLVCRFCQSQGEGSYPFLLIQRIDLISYHSTEPNTKCMINPTYKGFNCHVSLLTSTIKSQVKRSSSMPGQTVRLCFFGLSLYIPISIFTFLPVQLLSSNIHQVSLEHLTSAYTGWSTRYQYRTANFEIPVVRTGNQDLPLLWKEWMYSLAQSS